MKDKVYADAPQLIQELKEKIRVIIDEIEPQMCENVMENFLRKTRVFLINSNETFNWKTLY